ncbi:hypothetical protein BGZ70_007088 [Mortierella alpina]|uniref:Uncharacterized protein n=1 Tax=Mortierella alpina TaxID=64518 RepID=A0A9P6J958_MORAP|nr:hypothetical protein BGZ70_007088 [Mortierella alpina]
MSQKKDTDEAAKVVTDTNQDGMPLPPPPSYANSAGANSAAANASYNPPAGPPPSQSFYQAQPVGGVSNGSQQYAPPAGAPPNAGYASSPHASGHYIPAPAGGGYAPPPGHTVVYVVDNDRNNINNVDGMAPGPAIPVAMICFIFG